jgi:3-keto-5-aminohexanoate cleavage enzyme
VDQGPAQEAATDRGIPSTKVLTPNGTLKQHCTMSIYCIQYLRLVCNCRSAVWGNAVEKLIIEARINEYSMRDSNQNVPWLTDEIARDAEAVRAAGASIVHFHARAADGSPDHSLETYAAIIRGIRKATDLIVHPTLGQITLTGDRARAANIIELAKDRILRPELAAIDLGSTNLGEYSFIAKTFNGADKTYVNTFETLTFLAKSFRDAGVHTAVSCWSTPFVRALDALFDMELLPTPTWVMFVHTGGGVYGGHPPTPAGLRAYLDFLPQHRPIVWSACSKPGNLFATAAQAIQLGGHVSIGIGDHSYAELGCPTNGELIRRLVDLANLLGREVATPQEARRILGLNKT